MIKPKSFSLGVEFEIVWEDGHKSVFPLRFLRGNCPCASCVNEITRKRIVSEDDIADSIAMEDVQKTGNYALSFLWSDGHFSGIYSFEYLRALCQCGECRKLK